MNALYDYIYIYIDMYREREMYNTCIALRASPFCLPSLLARLVALTRIFLGPVHVRCWHPAEHRSCDHVSFLAAREGGLARRVA